MSGMLMSVVLFAVGLVLLIKGGDWFVDGATGIAKRFNLPDIVVGATVVSIGTTCLKSWFPPPALWPVLALWLTAMQSAPSSATLL